MGSELAQRNEWSEARSLDWHLLDNAPHRGIQTLVGALNYVEASEPALVAADFVPEGFRWIDASDTDQSVYSFLRTAPGDDARPVACVANFTPVPRHGYRLGLPHAGQWVELCNTDEARFGGSGVTNGETWTDDVEWHGYGQSVVLTLPPLAVIYLAPT
jgi:1,4-alpha-glucan branching enzyme